MRVRDGDYLIARIGEKKKALLLAQGDSKEWPVNCVVADATQKTKARVEYEIQEEDVLANLGSDPENGSVHGVKVEPWYENLEVKHWGLIQVYRKLEDDERAKLIKTLRIWGKKLKKRKLFGFAPVEFHIRPKAGKWSGTYHYRPKEDTVDLLTLKPESFTDNSYLITHECGHGVWFRLLTRKQKASWIKLYHRSVQLKKANLQEVEKLGQDYASSKQTVREFNSELSETDQVIFEAMISWAYDNHHLEPKHLDTLMEAGQEVQPYLPNEEMLLSDVEPMVSEYGATSPEEFFAEAFSFVMVDRSLPSKVAKLMRKTLSNLRR